MLTFWRTPGGGTGLWWPPIVVGLFLVALGVLIWVYPELFAYPAGAFLVLVGIGMVGASIRLRRRVTYRRFDDPPGPGL